MRNFDPTSQGVRGSSFLEPSQSCSEVTAASASSQVTHASDIALAGHARCGMRRSNEAVLQPRLKRGLSPA